MMADLDARVKVSVEGLDGFTKLNNSIDTVQKKLVNFRTAVLGLGLAAVGRSAIAMADDLQDLSNASGIATARLLEFKKALVVAGGQADQMPTAINQFLRSIDEAAQGSIKAQNSFMNLGVGIEDLRTLGEQDLLLKTLDGIAALQSPTERAAAMMDKFGKSFKTVDPAELADKMRSSAGSMDKYAESVKRAAELNDQLATAQGTLKLAMLEAFSPIIQKVVEFNDAVNSGSKKIDTLVSIIKALAIAISVAFAFTAVGAAVRVIGTMARGVGYLIQAFGGLSSAVGAVGTRMVSIFNNNSKVMMMLRGVGTLITGIAAGVATAIGLNPSNEGAGAGRGGQGGPTAEELKQHEQEQTKLNALREVETKQRENAIQAVRQITAEYAKQINQQQNRMNLEADLIGLSDDEKTRRTQQYDLAQKYNDTVEQLVEKRRALTKEEEYLIPIYNEQIKKVAELYVQQSQGLDQVINKQIIANALEKDRQNIIDAINKQIEQQVHLGEQLQKANDKLADVRFEGKISGLTPYQKQLAQIKEENRKAAMEAGRAYAAQFENMDLTAAQAEEVANGLGQIEERYKAIYEQQVKNLEQSRTFADGWAQAFGEYVDNATNAAQQAKNIFGQATKGMEDMIVNFAKTGKFEFRGFINSILEMLLRSQVQQLIAKIFNINPSMSGGGGSSGGLLGGRIIPGILASGGPVSGNRPYIVGERGPELFLPGGNGSMVPNNGLSTATNVTYNISAVDAASFKSLIARDPGFIHAVAQSGARSSMPLKRR